MTLQELRLEGLWNSFRNTLYFSIRLFRLLSVADNPEVFVMGSSPIVDIFLSFTASCIRVGSDGLEATVR